MDLTSVQVWFLNLLLQLLLYIFSCSSPFSGGLYTTEVMASSLWVFCGLCCFLCIYPLFILLPWFLTHFPFPALMKAEDNFSKVGGIFYFVKESNIITLSECNYMWLFWVLPKWWESCFISVRVMVLRNLKIFYFFQCCWHFCDLLY